MKYLLCFLGWLAGIALIRAFPHRSLPAAIGVLLFAAFSLVLLALLARLVVRWLKSQHRGVRWALTGGAVLLLLSLFAFQRLNIPSDKTKIEKTIEAVTIGADPSYCETKLTPRYLEQITGAKPPFADEVCRGEIEMSRAESVDTSEVAIDDTRATAVVAFGGGSFDGSRLAVGLVRENGDWKLNRILAFRHFDRNKFDHAYRRSFLELGSPTSSANCALRRARRLSNAEIERAALTDSRRAFDPIFVACDRDGAERALVSSIAEPKFDFPSRAVQCAAGRLKALSDAELVHVQLSPMTFDKLIYGCGYRAVFAYMERELKSRESLDREAVDCVLRVFRSRPTAGAIRLSYDQARYSQLIDGCKQ
ncbi:MAG: hypothetical protein ACM3N0_12070 [Chloroflexota bacterium]